MLKDAFVARFGIGCSAFGVQVVDVNIPELSGISPAAHGFNQILGNTGHAAQVHVIARLKHFHGLIGRNGFGILVHAVFF
jgi:hypothetical protein